MIPFRNDHVGSFLRPADLSQAREQYKSGNITYEELRAVEDKEIIRIIEKQKENGVFAVTDGEFRRSWWHFDFLGGLDGVELYEQIDGPKFHNMQTRKGGIRVVGKVDFSSHPFVEDFEFLKKHAGDAVAKAVQLQMEYDPQPPFTSGSPKTAPPQEVEQAKAKMAAFIATRRAATMRAAQRLQAEQLPDAGNTQ